MVIFISGGTGSGKSDFAESLVMNSGFERRTYIATMNVWDAEGEKRVQRHRDMRRGKGFHTVERPHDLAGLPVPKGAVLLEDLTNLFMNEYFNVDSAGAAQRVEKALKLYAEKCELFIIVSNDIFSGGDSFPGDMGDYYALLGRMNSFAARLADECYEVSNMQPIKRTENGNCRGLTLIIGGSHQGKSAWALEHCDRGRGACVDVKNAANSDIFLQLHDWLKTEKDPIPKLDQLIDANPNITIVCDEIGCGVVPLGSDERSWRERVGRSCCHLADRADTVIRIWCGIATVLKGGAE